MACYLAIETSSRFPSIALSIDGQLFCWQGNNRKSQAEALLPAISTLLETQQITPLQLDAVFYNSGPGSFTGLRIGASLVQGLSFSCDIPVYPISAFDVMLQQSQLVNDARPKTVLVLIDAQMGDVYYRQLESRDVDYEVLDTGIMPVADIAGIWQPDLQEQIAVLLQGLSVESVGLDNRPVEHVMPDAAALLSCGVSGLQRGISPVRPNAVVPDYIRKTVSWKKWQPKSAGGN